MQPEPGTPGLQQEKSSPSAHPSLPPGPWTGQQGLPPLNFATTVPFTQAVTHTWVSSLQSHTQSSFHPFVGLP